MNVNFRHLSRALAGLGVAALSAFTGAAVAATADVANEPLAFQSSSSVRPNLMFILDDSGSMGDDFVPDGLSNSNGRCFGYFGYNKIFYDPSQTYTVPNDATGSSLGAASFASAKSNGFSSSGGTTDLSNTSNLSTQQVTVATTGPITGAPVVTGPTVCGNKSTDSACSTTPTSTTSTSSSSTSGITTTTSTTTNKTFVRGSAPGKTCTTTTSSNSCTLTTTTTVTTSTATTSRFYWATLNSGASVTCNDANYSVVYDPITLTTAQKQNYANWWAYYRTRILAMKSAAGRVFGAIDATRFRVGYSTIHETGYSNSSNGFLSVGDFDTQKTTFFTKLYGATTGNSTPLRPALEKAGRYFAGVQMNDSALPAGTDPVQYYCQRNYTLLSTDGYWNKGDEGNFRSSYSPRQLGSSTAIGNQDGGATARPMLDDGHTVGTNWVTGGSGVSDSLADIAMYFYKTDLRTSNCTVNNQDVCTNDVKPSGNDTATHQHMTTYTLGLGVAGSLTYQSNYDDPSLTTGDFYAIRQGSKAWPDPQVSSSGTSVPTRADDLWHAAVNGRGKYYSAGSPADLVTAMTETLETISSVTGTGSAAAVSSQQPVSGDNFVYLAEYTTVLWEGNLKALTLNPATGVVTTSNPSWEAKNTLLSQVSSATDTRNIYFAKSGATNGLASFTYANLPSASQAYFSNVCQSGNYKLSQCADLAAAGTAGTANSGDTLVKFLRGQTQYEDVAANAAAARLFRGRNTPLGDIVNATPVYVKKPPFAYQDSGYSAFVSANASRTAMVYVGANDGMLHAFNATTGAELWAYVPSMVMSNMYLLADKQYSTKHRFYVDGAPTVSDVFDGTNWRSILVGGLNAGGRGYYALDVTDPATPIALWEISSATDNDLGLTFGNPVITKNKAGTWVAAFTSGYNNVSPGSGNGYLYVRNALTGVSIDKIATYTTGTTAAGDTTTPSNLGKINAWVDHETDNTAKRIYGGDMLGNVWRFDFDDNIAPSGKEAFLLAQAHTPGGAAQPITTKPQLSAISANNTTSNSVIIGTGRLLGATDIGSTTVQSIYVFKDDLSTTSLGVLRNNPGMVHEVLGATRLVTSPQGVNWSTQSGWYMDFDVTANSGERLNTDMALSNNLLVVPANITTSTPCAPGGSSWLYFIDITATSNSISNVMSVQSADAMTAGINLIRTTDSNMRVIQWDVRGRPTTGDVPPGGGPGTPLTRRTSWRELVD
ncbi:pilus assembly protein [Piscinibacter sp.]|jgi:type IV pilus assembly protein PilY1|uniref:pilus assembly protein n=1 Tax=Piscinibacter sp. TaxID=1903157 RepID=UPI00355A44DA